MNFPQTKLSKVAKFINGYPFKQDDWMEEGYPIIRIQNLTNKNRPYNYTKVKVPQKHYVKCGDILVSWSATIDVFEWSGPDALLNQHIFKVEFDQTKVNKEFFKIALKKTISDLSKYAHGSTMKHVVKKDFEEHLVPIPEDIDDQIRIAHLLSKVEELIAQRKQHLQQLDDLLKSIFLDMFGDPVRNEKGWDKKCISEILKKIDSGKSPKCEARVARHDEWGVLKLGAVTSCYFKEGENKALPVNSDLNQSYEVKSGDLLFSRKNTYELVAACAYVFEARPKLLLPDLIFRFVFKDDVKVNPIFFWKLMISNTQRAKIQSLASGAAGSMPNISKTNLLNAKVPVPPESMQTKFATIVEKVESIKQKYQHSLTNLQTLYNSLSQKAFKGELDLSRIPLIIQEQPTEIPPNLEEEFNQCNEDLMSTPKGRKQLLENTLNNWLQESNTKSKLTIDSFWEDANLQSADHQNEDTPQSFSPDDYNHLRKLIFKAIKNGKLKQTRNKIKINKEADLGNEVILQKC